MPQPPDLIELVSDSVRESLGHVEAAFDRRPEPPERPPASWHEHDGLMLIVQRLISARHQKRPESAWSTIDQMCAMLPTQSIELINYDDTRRPEEQADAFVVESRDGRS